MHRRRLLALLVVAVGTWLVAAPESALAHGLVGRQDLPIPKWLFGWAAAVVLVASFVGLAVLWPKPRLEGAAERRVAGVPRFLDPLAGAIGLAFFVLVVYAGFQGSQTTTNNLAPTVVFVLFWVGIPVASLIFGDVFMALNPWRAAARAVSWVAAKFSRGGLPAPMAYPAWLGRWPAALGIFAFAWIELVYSGRGDPSNLAVARARLRRRAVRRHEPLRHRALEPPRRRVRRVLRAARADVAAALGARRAVRAQAAERADDARRRARHRRAR